MGIGCQPCVQHSLEYWFHSMQQPSSASRRALDLGLVGRTFSTLWSPHDLEQTPYFSDPISSLIKWRFKKKHFLGLFWGTNAFDNYKFIIPTVRFLILSTAQSPNCPNLTSHLSLLLYSLIDLDHRAHHHQPYLPVPAAYGELSLLTPDFRLIWTPTVLRLTHYGMKSENLLRNCI